MKQSYTNQSIISKCAREEIRNLDGTTPITDGIAIIYCVIRDQTQAAFDTSTDAEV